ncbi:TPA: hypothetical protein N2D87_003640 [Clostridium botulinum]|nr:hypothetical protein [Clostridium botulinum]NFB52171.1 hypothetical protein [Clostridium botulinum]NFC86453.1 hypothetical protein [Clostridium botulinum]NFD96489.1 hypothetical protein [Clostridium botulinum]NFF12362.1 hypothetical protein [Clostridium botulinum]
MIYKDFIKTDSNFQYSINLQYDIKNFNKIESYIPTKLSMDILKGYLNSILYKNDENASVLVGPYGKGKSHLLLILSAIVSMEEEYFDENINKTYGEKLKILIEKIKKVDKECGQLIEDFREKNKCMLPVIINSNYIDLKQAFLLGIKEALDREGLSYLIPENYFTEALDTIDRWSKNYKETYQKFKSIIEEKYSYTIRKFKKELGMYNEDVYKIFTDIHPRVTAGTKFNPLINGNIVKLYESLNLSIANNTKFKGMVVIFDEFSKFLEASASKNVADDMKLLQEFAEMTFRMEEIPIYLICVTHRDIEEYTAKLSKEQINSWRTVSGRFKHKYFTSSSNQNYELIGNAIHKDEKKFEKYISDLSVKGALKKHIDEVIGMGIFQENENVENIIGYKCFPLNPISIFVLPRVSEKVAQNERTLFTFISKNEKGSLNRFIDETKEFKLLNVEWIYDYFKDLFKKEVFNESVHTNWLSAESTLAKCNNYNEKSIIKTLAIVYIVNELEMLPPNSIILRLGTGLNEKEFKCSLEELLRRNLLFKKSYNGHYYFGNLNNINFNEKIKNKIENNVNKIDVLNVINSIVKSEYILPREYNDAREITRFFKVEYITAIQFKAIYDENLVVKESNSDGIIYNLIYFNEDEKKEVISHLDTLKSKRILVCIPNETFKKEYEIKEYWAINDLILKDSDISTEETSIKELEILKEDLFQNITNYFKSEFDITAGKCKYFMFKVINDKVKNISKRIDLNKVLSELCNDYYCYTPVIRSELINKNNLSTPIKKVRDKIIQFIFDDMQEEDEFIGSSAEATIYRATIKNLGITRKLDIESMNQKDEYIKFVIGVIENFFTSCVKKRKAFQILYDKLRGEKFGLRLGVIPIYIALYMNQCKDKVILYYGNREVNISIENINNINNYPEKYSAFLEDGSAEEKEYVRKLLELFKRDNQQKRFAYNKNILVVEEIQKWFHCLSKYTQRHDYMMNIQGEYCEIDEDKERFRNKIIKPYLNPREILFEDLPKNVIKSENLNTVYERISVIKDYYDCHLVKLKQALTHKLIEIFNTSYNGTLRSALKYWYQNLPKESKVRIYEPTTNMFLKIAKGIDKYEETLLINEIAKEVTGLFIEDWEDNVAKVFIERIYIIKGEIEKEEVAADIDENRRNYKIVSSENVEKQINIGKISDDGEMIYNEMLELIDNETGNMQANEKVAILFKLLEKYM